MVHAKNISVTEKEKGYEVRFEIGFDKSLSKKTRDRLGRAFPQRRVLAFATNATQSEIENRIKIEVARLNQTVNGFEPKATPDSVVVAAMNNYFDGKTIK